MSLTKVYTVVINSTYIFVNELVFLRSAYDLLKSRLPESDSRSRRINQSLISMFSQDHKLYTSDYNPISNSVASENQP